MIQKNKSKSFETDNLNDQSQYNIRRYLRKLCKTLLEQSSVSYKVGSYYYGVIYDPYKWPKINGFNWCFFHPYKGSYTPKRLT